MSGRIVAAGGECEDSMQDYKSLRAAVMIRATLVNTPMQTHRQFLTGYTVSSAS